MRYFKSKRKKKLEQPAVDLGYDCLILDSAFSKPISRRTQPANADAAVHYSFPGDCDPGRTL